MAKIPLAMILWYIFAHARAFHRILNEISVSFINFLECCAGFFFQLLFETFIDVTFLQLNYTHLLIVLIILIQLLSLAYN